MKTKRWMTFSNFIDRTLEPVIIYIGAAAHYVSQYLDLMDVESGVNIALGIGLIVYTTLKIIQIYTEIKRRGEGVPQQLEELVKEFLEQEQEKEE